MTVILAAPFRSVIVVSLPYPIACANTTDDLDGARQWPEFVPHSIWADVAGSELLAVIWEAQVAIPAVTGKVILASR